MTITQEQVQELSFKNISLECFVAMSRKDESKEGAIADMVKAMQNGAFVILWNQYVRKSIKTYQNVGQVFNMLVPNAKQFEERMKQLEVRPEVGVIRARSNYGEDFRFISIVKDGMLWCLFENPAVDSSYGQVWKYDTNSECFYEANHYTMLDFCIKLSLDVLG